jgi:hypothetical protein
VDLKGERWACLLRTRGLPLCLPLHGSGARGAWTDVDNRLHVALRRQLIGSPENTAWREAARKLYTQRLAPLGKHLRNLSDKEAKVAVASLPRDKVVPRKPR